jgi:probable HAF family extracellular repeat protein
MTDLGAMPGSGLGGSWANGINNRGQVVGSSAGRAFLWEKGGMTDLGTLPGRDFSWANDINDRGQVVGFSDSDDAAQHAFLWEKGRMIDLGTLPSGDFSEAIGINNGGQVVGVSTTDSNTAVHAFLWEDGQMTDLGTLPGGDGSVALAINSRGQVVGYDLRLEVIEHDGQDVPVDVPRAFLWEDGRMTDLGAQSGEFYSVASDINNRGQVVGTSASEALVILRCCNIVLLWDWHAVVWSKGNPEPRIRSTDSDSRAIVEGPNSTAPPLDMRGTSADSSQERLLRHALYPAPFGPDAADARAHPNGITRKSGEFR